MSHEIEQVGELTLGLDNISVEFFRGDDGALVVQIDTTGGGGRLRVNINDGAVWDANPETHHHDFCDCVHRP